MIENEIRWFKLSMFPGMKGVEVKENERDVIIQTPRHVNDMKKEGGGQERLSPAFSLHLPSQPFPS